jgi:hypothetical protein
VMPQSLRTCRDPAFSLASINKFVYVTASLSTSTVTAQDCESQSGVCTQVT